MNLQNIVLFLMAGFLVCGCNSSSLVKINAKQALEEKGVEVSRYELYKYSSSNNKEIEKLFYEAGEKPLTDKEKLLFASYEGHIDLVKQLLDKGVGVNSDDPCLSPIIAAASKGHLDIIKLLRAKGASIDIVEGKGPFSTSALLEAVRGNHLDCAKFLLEEGSDPNAIRGDCLAPSDAVSLAVENENPEMVKLLVSYHGRIPYDDCELNFKEMLKPAITGDKEGIKTTFYILDEAYPQISLNQYTKYHLLAAAVKYGNKKIVEYLLFEKKMKPTEVTIEIAKKYKRNEILKLLKKRMED